MNPTTKRVLMNHMTKKQEEEKRREEEERRRYGMSDRYDGRNNRGFGGVGEEDGSGYHEMVEDRFRDRRGREHYDNGRYAPMDMGYMRMGDEHYPDASRYPEMRRYGGGRTVRNENDDWVESRQRRDSRGRYTSHRSEYEGNYGADGRYPDWPYVPPVYERERGTRRKDTREGYRPMNKIGFALEGEMERMPNEAHHDYKTAAGYEQMDESAYRKGERSGGYGEGRGYAPLTKQMAMEWEQQMENVDGTHGPHWTMEQTKQVMAQKNISDIDPLEFNVAMNMMFSDYAEVAKKMGVNKIDFYVCMAKAFLDDPDAGPDKLARYYEYVVK